MSGNYPEGDTYSESYVDSARPFANLDPGAPDDRGYNPGGDAVFATGPLRIDGDSVQTRYSDPGCVGGGGGGAIDGGDA